MVVVEYDSSDINNKRLLRDLTKKVMECFIGTFQPSQVTHNVQINISVATKEKVTIRLNPNLQVNLVQFGL